MPQIAAAGGQPRASPHISEGQAASWHQSVTCRCRSDADVEYASHRHLHTQQNARMRSQSHVTRERGHCRAGEERVPRASGRWRRAAKTVVRSQEYRLVYLYLGVYKNLDRVIFLLFDIFKIGIDALAALQKCVLYNVKLCNLFKCDLSS